MFNAILAYFGHLLVQLGPLEWLLIFMLLGATVVLIHAQNKEGDEFDLRHLVSDTSSGKVVLEKFSMFGAFLFSSWGLVALIVKGTLSEWYFIGYMAAWAATGGFYRYLQTKGGGDAQQK